MKQKLTVKDLQDALQCANDQADRLIQSMAKSATYYEAFNDLLQKALKHKLSKDQATSYLLRNHCISYDDCVALVEQLKPLLHDHAIHADPAYIESIRDIQRIEEDIFVTSEIELTIKMIYNHRTSDIEEYSIIFEDTDVTCLVESLNVDVNELLETALNQSEEWS